MHLWQQARCASLEWRRVTARRTSETRHHIAVRPARLPRALRCAVSTCCTLSRHLQLRHIQLRQLALSATCQRGARRRLGTPRRHVSAPAASSAPPPCAPCSGQRRHIQLRHTQQRHFQLRHSGGRGARRGYIPRSHAADTVRRCSVSLSVDAGPITPRTRPAANQCAPCAAGKKTM